MFIKTKYFKHLFIFILVSLIIIFCGFPSFAETYSISDFNTIMINGYGDFSSTVYVKKLNRVLDGKNIIVPFLFNSDSAFYSSNDVKLIQSFKLTNFSLKDEYNLNFYSTCTASNDYTIMVYLKNGDDVISMLYDSKVTGHLETYFNKVDVNFTLSNLGLTSNDKIYLEILVIVEKKFQNQFGIGFTDINLINLNDNSSDTANILDWLNRIYYSIVGCTDELKTKLDTCVTSLNNNFNSQLNTLWSNLNIKLNSINTNLLNFKSVVEGFFNDFFSFFDNKFSILFEKLDILIKGKESSKDDFDSSGKDEFDKINSDIEDTEGNLPDFNGSDFNNVINTDILSNLSKGFIALNTVFSIVVDKLGFTSVLVFFLSFGLGIYIIGRRLGGA